jgi:hypothetical protein
MYDTMYDVDDPRIPVFRTETGKAECDLCPILVLNFVPTGKVLEPRMRFVDDDHLNVEEMAGMCAEALEDGNVLRLREVDIRHGEEELWVGEKESK